MDCSMMDMQGMGWMMGGMGADIDSDRRAAGARHRRALEVPESGS